MRADLKSLAARHVGSIPTVRTKYAASEDGRPRGEIEAKPAARRAPLAAGHPDAHHLEMLAQNSRRRRGWRRGGRHDQYA